MAKKVLVTGGTGYIGSHTAVELISQGMEVFIADNLSNSSVDVLDGIEKITGIRPHFDRIDLTDKTETENYFSRHTDLDAVIHFAALKAVGESVQEPLKYYSNNIESLINILNGMIGTHIKNLVFSSSCTVYGQPETLPVNEDSPVKKAMSPYGNTKQISEEIIRDTCESVGGLNAILLRYFNPIGAHPTASIGELPLGVPNNLVPFITQTAAGIRDELEIFGNDYNTPDGTCIRDYIYVCDLAKAHVAALNRLFHVSMSEKTEIFNLGTGHGLSVLEVVNAFEKATGIAINYKITSRRDGDIEKVWADASKANKVLQWTADEPIENVMLSAWKWEKKYRGIE